MRGRGGLTCTSHMSATGVIQEKIGIIFFQEETAYCVQAFEIVRCFCSTLSNYVIEVHGVLHLFH